MIEAHHAAQKASTCKHIWVHLEEPASGASTWVNSGEVMYQVGLTHNSKKVPKSSMFSSVHCTDGCSDDVSLWVAWENSRKSCFPTEQSPAAFLGYKHDIFYFQI